MKKLLFALLLLPLPAIAQSGTRVSIYNTSPVPFTIHVNNGDKAITVAAANASNGFMPQRQSTNVTFATTGAGTFGPGNNTVNVLPSNSPMAFVVPMNFPQTAAKWKSVQIYITYAKDTRRISLTLLGDGDFVSTSTASR